MDLQTIIQSLSSLSTDDLRTLNEQVVSTIKFKRTQEGSLVKNTLSVGDTVQFTGKRGAVLTGELIKKNRTKAVVRVDFTQWTVPFSMLSLVEGGA